VQVVLLDRKVQAALDRFAREQGEDAALLDRLFHQRRRVRCFQHAPAA